MILVLKSCSTTQVVTNDFCYVGKKIPYNKDLFLEVWKFKPEIEDTLRGVINHNDVYNSMCKEVKD